MNEPKLNYREAPKGFTAKRINDTTIRCRHCYFFDKPCPEVPCVPDSRNDRCNVIFVKRKTRKDAKEEKNS